MKKQLPTLLLAIACVALLAAYLQSNNKIAQLEQAIAAQSSGETQPKAETPNSAPIVASRGSSEAKLPAATPIDPPPEEAGEPGRRLMKSIAKLMDDPSINKVVEASQRGTLSALYTDLIGQLNLNEEESAYFMDLLMKRQMATVDYAMKAMAGDFSPEELAAMQAEIADTTKMVEEEIATFLNNPADFEEFKYYEDTANERLMLSGLEDSLKGTDLALSDETYRDLLDVMHDERTGFSFSTDLADPDNYDMSAERLSAENMKLLANDLRDLNKNIVESAKDILTPGQLDAFQKSIDSNLELQVSQLEMVAEMFGQ